MERTDEIPHRVLHLADAEIKAMRQPKKPFGLKLTTARGRTYELCAETIADQTDWIDRMTDLAEHGGKSHFLLSPRSKARTATVSAPRVLHLQPSNSVATVRSEEKPRGRAATASVVTSPRVEVMARGVKKEEESDAEDEEEADRLYKQHAERLQRGGIEKHEFRRNSKAILQVLAIEEDMDASNRRNSRLSKPSAAMSESAEDAELAAMLKRSPRIETAEKSGLGAAEIVSPRGEGWGNFVGRRGSLQIERKHPTLRDLCIRDQDPTKKYKKLTKIGEGSFGIVYVAQEQVSKRQVAVKKMAITKKNRVHLEMELELHQASSDHPNVVCILESYIVQDSKNYQVWAILEFLDNVKLNSLIPFLFFVIQFYFHL